MDRPPPPNYHTSTESVVTEAGAPAAPVLATTPAATQHFPEQQPHTVEHFPEIYQQPAGANENSPLMSIPGEIRPEIIPSDYLILSIVVAVVCFMLNPFSLFCSIPAIMQANMAFEKKHKGELEKAKRHGNYAAYLMIACALWVMFFAVLATSLITGLILARK